MELIFRHMDKWTDGQTDGQTDMEVEEVEIVNHLDFLNITI